MGARRTSTTICQAAVVAGMLLFPVGSFAEAAGAAPAGDSSTASTNSTADMNQLYDAGRQLFDQLAPPEVKAQYEFPTREQWDAFASRLQKALESGSLDELAGYAPQARATLATLRSLGVDDELADWLEQRLDEVEAAQQARSIPPPPFPPVAAPTPPAGPPEPRARPVPPRSAPIPYYDLWISRVRGRPVPDRAAALMPTLRRAFSAEGAPPGLAWLAEAESSLNPNARSPAGAKGLFQLMPDTAHRLGLDTFLPDERTDPEKSARATARYLRELHEKFGSWPLALAAYNAGEGRISRTLSASHASDYASIAGALPAETRMYVPKVCALVAVRSGASLAAQ